LKFTSEKDENKCGSEAGLKVSGQEKLKTYSKPLRL